MTAKYLADLPNEMQLACLEWLDLPGLAAVSMASRSLRQLAQPQMYMDIVLEWTVDRHPSILLLVRSLLENPGLCSYVRCLRLNGHIYRSADNEEEPRRTLPTNVALPLVELSQAVLESGVAQDVAHMWKIKARLGDVDAVVALLVSLLPNLGSLAVQSSWTVESHYLGHVFRAAVCNKRRPGLRHPPRTTFDKLIFVSCAPREIADEHTEDENSADMLALFYLPKIKTISVSMDNPVNFAWPGSQKPAPLLLTTLQLHRIRECRLGPILARLKNLQTLHYNWFYQSDIDRSVSDMVVDLDTMATAITRCKTLRILEITALTLPAYRLGELHAPLIALNGSLAKLSKLPRLKVMSVPWVFLAGVSDIAAADGIGTALPRSLQHLTLRSDMAEQYQPEWVGENMILAMEGELEGMSSLRNLRTVSLPGFSADVEEFRACKAQVKRISARFNLRLMVINCQKGDEDMRFNIG